MNYHSPKIVFWSPLKSKWLVRHENYTKNSSGKIYLRNNIHQQSYGKSKTENLLPKNKITSNTPSLGTTILLWNKIEFKQHQEQGSG